MLLIYSERYLEKWLQFSVSQPLSVPFFCGDGYHDSIASDDRRYYSSVSRVLLLFVRRKEILGQWERDLSSADHELNFNLAANDSPPPPPPATYYPRYYYGLIARPGDRKKQLIEWHFQSQSTADSGMKAKDSYGHPCNAILQCLPSCTGMVYLAGSLLLLHWRCGFWSLQHFLTIPFGLHGYGCYCERARKEERTNEFFLTFFFSDSGCTQQEGGGK